MSKYDISVEMSAIIAVYLALQEIAKTSLFCKIRNSIIRNNKMSKTDNLHYRLCCEGAMLCSIMRREGVRKGIFNYRK